MTIDAEILQAIRNAMPPNAEIEVVPGAGAFNVRVYWKLNDDLERPNKMSKTISISVSHEAAQDFASASAADQGAAYERVASFLSAKLAGFDPRHNLPKYEPPPVEQWVVSSSVLLGGYIR
jgi:hypothetical protein